MNQQLQLKAGDTITATFDLRDHSDQPEHQPYTVTGVAYELERHPGDLWVGGQLLVKDGRLGSWITVEVVEQGPVTA